MGANNNGLSTKFNEKAVKPSPTSENAPRIINVPPSNEERLGANSASFRHIFETGEAPHTDKKFDGTLPPPYKVDWKADDAFNQAMARIEAKVTYFIEKMPSMQELLKKDSWSMEDRQKWEDNVQRITHEEMVKEFGPYRSEGTKAPQDHSAKRNPNLNALGDDVGKGEYSRFDKLDHAWEFDCEAMSIVKGAIMQRMDDKLLPKTPGAEGDLKYQAEYRYNVGVANIEPTKYRDGVLGGHAWIMSPLTKNVIEGTVPEYLKNINQGQTFPRLAQGDIAVTQDDISYGPWPSIKENRRETQTYKQFYDTELRSQSACGPNVYGKLDSNDAIGMAKEAVGSGKPLNADVMQMVRDIMTRDDMKHLAKVVGALEKEWENVFKSADGDPNLSTLVKESFERNFLNPLKRSGIPFEEKKDGFKTLGESLQEWAKPHLDRLDENIRNAPAISTAPAAQAAKPV